MAIDCALNSINAKKKIKCDKMFCTVRLYYISIAKVWALDVKKGTSRQRSGKGAIRKRFPLQKPYVKYAL